MLGAIIGDIVGSVYERQSIKTKSFPLFRDDCSFTDDTVMTIATAEALWKGAESNDFIEAYRKYGRAFPNVGYGRSFWQWLCSENPTPYNSFGNGSAMRVSPVARMLSLSSAEKYAKKSAEVTHNHPEGIRGAQAAAAAVFLASWWRFERDIPSVEERKREVKAYVEETYGYDLDRTINEIKPTYTFEISCQETVPQAIIAFLESDGFEDAIRNAISLGGDSDTLAAITGSIAEAAYGIPPEIHNKALTYLPMPLFNAVDAWYTKMASVYRTGVFTRDPCIDLLQSGSI